MYSWKISSTNRTELKEDPFMISGTVQLSPRDQQLNGISIYF